MKIRLTRQTRDYTKKWVVKHQIGLTGSYVLDPNRGDCYDAPILALDARQVTEPDSDDAEDQELLVLSKDEIKNHCMKVSLK